MTWGTELARAAEDGYRLFVRRIRTGPQDTDKRHAEHPPSKRYPLQRAYWQGRGEGLGLGHVLKYPYGYYGLMRLARSDRLKERCLQVAYRIF